MGECPAHRGIFVSVRLADASELDVSPITHCQSNPSGRGGETRRILYLVTASLPPVPIEWESELSVFLMSQS